MNTATAFDLKAVFSEASEMTPTDAALHYAGNGVPVFPCDPESKRPLVSGGFKSATDEPASVRDWWEKWPAAMIGSPTGKTFDVFDLDGKTGIDNLLNLGPVIEAAPDIGGRARCETPGGGWHVYTAPVPNLKSTAGKLGANLDTRANGGYVILPGSVRADGGKYTFTAGSFTDAPGWLVDLCREKGVLKGTTSPKPAPSAPIDFQPGIPPNTRALIESGTGEGNRNSTAFEIACQLRDEGLSEPEAVGLVEAYAARCNPPLPMSEAGTACKSAFSQPRREPARDTSKPEWTPLKKAEPVTIVSDEPLAPESIEWDADPVPLGGFHSKLEYLPAERLPLPVWLMCEAVRDTYRAPADLITAAALGVLSVASRNLFKVEMKADHRTHTNLFFMGALPPGGMKTPVQKAFQKPLEDWQREARPAYEKALADWTRKAGIIESKIKGIRKACERTDTKSLDILSADRDIAELEAQLGPRPAPPVAFTTDATSEALSRIMSGNEGCAAVMSSEARQMLSIAKGRYTEGGDIALWLGGHAGDYTRIDRRGSEPVEIPHPCLSALVLTQPDSLAELGAAPAMRESGFLARWLYVCPETTPSTYNTESVPVDTACAWSRLVLAIMNYPPAQGPEGEPMPHIMKMNRAALDLWREFHDEVQRKIYSERETLPAILQGWESKLPDHVARLAGLMRIVCHVAEGEPLHTVTASDVEAALALVPSLRSHAARAVEGMGATPEASRSRKVWEWIQKNRAKLRDTREAEGLGALEVVKPRDLERAGVSGISKASEAVDVLDLLSEKGWLHAVSFKREGTTAKASALYYIRPMEVCP